jgi:tetratricopeptide (TPR) repeat protein
LDRRGRFDEGSRHIKEARDRDPVSIQANIQLAWHYYFVNSIPEAIVTIERTLELKPDYSPGYALMSLCLLEQQQRDRARELALHLEESRFPYVLPVIGHVMAHCGDPKRTQQFVMELQTRRSDEPGRWAFHIACLHASLDEREPARSWLQVAYDEREAALSCLCLWPYFDEMAADPAVAKMRNQLDLALAPRVG